MDFTYFKIEKGRLVIHKDHLDDAVHELEVEGREYLLDALWMGCDVQLKREGTVISITVSVYTLPETEEECFDNSSTPLLVYLTDIFKNMDGSGYLTFTGFVDQSIPTEGSGTVEDVFYDFLQHPF